MKHFLKICLLVVSIATFAQNPTVDKNSSEKMALSTMIDELIASEKLHKDAVVVLNGDIVAKEKRSEMLFHKSEILTMNVFDKDNKIMIGLYGKESANGVLLIQTTPREIKLATTSKSNVLYLINDKIATEAAVHALNPDTIASINILKGKKEVAKYSTNMYDGVILITLK